MLCTPVSLGSKNFLPFSSESWRQPGIKQVFIIGWLLNSLTFPLSYRAFILHLINADPATNQFLPRMERFIYESSAGTPRTALTMAVLRVGGWLADS